MTRHLAAMFVYLAVVFSVVPVVVFADSYSLSPGTWLTLGDSMTYHVGSTNYGGSGYVDCFDSDGAFDNRCEGGGAQSPGDYTASLSAFWSGQSTLSGAVHMVVVNVDAGAGYSGWVANCEGANTYSDCITYLLSDRPGQYVSLASVFSGGAPPSGDGSATSSIEQSQQNLFNGFLIFFISFFGMIWLLRPRT